MICRTGGGGQAIAALWLSSKGWYYLTKVPPHPVHRKSRVPQTSLASQCTPLTCCQERKKKQVYRSIAVVLGAPRWIFCTLHLPTVELTPLLCTPCLIGGLCIVWTPSQNTRVVNGQQKAGGGFSYSVRFSPLTLPSVSSGATNLSDVNTGEKSKRGHSPLLSPHVSHFSITFCLGREENLYRNMKYGGHKWHLQCVNTKPFSIAKKNKIKLLTP